MPVEPVLILIVARGRGNFRADGVHRRPALIGRPTQIASRDEVGRSGRSTAAEAAVVGGLVGGGDDDPGSTPPTTGSSGSSPGSSS